MSTRGAIARAIQDGWIGVYNHSDSYPTGLGRNLWDALFGTEKSKVSEQAYAAITETEYWEKRSNPIRRHFYARY